MGDKFLTFLSKKKTVTFLLMCLCVHAFNIFLFLYLGIRPLFYLNIFSTAFYVAVLQLFKKNQDLYILFTYFEIITFSFICDIFTGCAFFYIFYVVGMVSVILYLLPPKTRMKHVIQGIGVAYAIVIYYFFSKKVCLFPQYQEIYDAYRIPLGFLNLLITIFTLFYVSNLYFFELNNAHEKLAYTSNHDLLTGLFNRRFFEYIMKRNKSEIENKYTIAIFDIDDFKKINDTYGHQAGDEVLKMVSKVIEPTEEKEYVPVRWGGEEFILFMPQTDEERAFGYLLELCDKVRNTTVEFDNKKINVTITIGMCTGTGLTDYESVIRIADDRLYTGKRSGKNRVVKD